MAVTPISELNDRARDIFRLVVENYLGSGVPVGSRTLSQAPGINLSPASIRNVMQELEDRGQLAAPHESARRMPTETGLRKFVYGLMQMAEPTEEERRVSEQRVGDTHEWLRGNSIPSTIPGIRGGRKSPSTGAEVREDRAGSRRRTGL